MSQTTTQKLGLTKDDGNEAFLDLRPHVNANMETIDDFAGDISDSIANFETNPATSNHSAGTYFMLENTLHRAKTAIASGESITSSNAEPITIAQVLNTLNSNVSALQDSVAKWGTNTIGVGIMWQGDHIDVNMRISSTERRILALYDTDIRYYRQNPDGTATRLWTISPS